MRLALRLHGGLPAAACVEQARAAERAGFSTVWFAENPFNRGVLPPIAAVRDAMQIIRPLLRGEEVDYAGKIFKAEKVRLEFPLRRASMPILMAAVGDQALRLAGELADGLMISNMCPPGYTRRAVGIMAEAAQAAGRSRP